MKGLNVQGPDCSLREGDCSGASITRYSIPKVSLEMSNQGELPVELELGDEGREILQSKCDLYDLKEFRVEKSIGADSSPVTGEEIELGPGESLDLQWFLELGKNVEYPENETVCLIHFGLEGSQEVETSQQIQIRGNENVPTVSGLSTYTSSRSPADLYIQVDRRIVQERIGGDIRPLIVESGLRNVANGSITSINTPGDVPVDISIDGMRDRDCSESGESIVPGTVCRFTPPVVEDSEIYEVVARTDYAYTWDLGTVGLEVGG